MYYQHEQIISRSTFKISGRFFTVSAMLFVLTCTGLALSKKAVGPVAGKPIDCTVVVYDVGIQSPLEGARVILRRGASIVGDKVTNPRGVALFRDIDTGQVRLTAHLVGYYDFSETVVIDESHPADTVTLKEISQQEVVVTAERELNVSTIDPGTGNQVTGARRLVAL